MTETLSDSELIATVSALKDKASPKAQKALDKVLQRLVDGGVRSVRDPDVAQDRFLRLADTWRKNRGPTSSISQMAMRPEYQAIIGMGHDAVPFLLDELRREPDHWFWALASITGDDPVAQEDKGKLPEMAKAWIDWGRDHGYLGPGDVPPPADQE